MKDPIKITCDTMGQGSRAVDSAALLDHMKARYEGTPINRNTYELVHSDIEGLMQRLPEERLSGEHRRGLEDALAYLLSVRAYIEGEYPQIKERRAREIKSLTER